jgi:hypothetical protein
MRFQAPQARWLLLNVIDMPTPGSSLLFISCTPAKVVSGRCTSWYDPQETKRLHKNGAPWAAAFVVYALTA